LLACFADFAIVAVLYQVVLPRPCQPLDILSSLSNSYLLQATQYGLATERRLVLIQARISMDRLLINAARDGHLALVEQALRNGADVGFLDYFGRTPLHRACENGHLEIVEYLWATGHANVGAADNQGQTPLHVACYFGRLDVVRYLLTHHGANLEASDDNGWTPLHLAILQRHHHVVGYLLTSHHPNLEARDNHQETALHLACELGHLDAARLLLNEGADLFATSGNGRTAFDWAAANARTHLVYYLLQIYAERVAAHNGPQATHAILQSAAFLDVTNGHPQPALAPRVHLPLGKLTLDQFQTLLQNHPANSIQSSNNNGALPLHVACQVGAPIEVVRLLLQEYAAALHTPDDTGAWPLHIACQAAAPLLVVIRFLTEQDPNALQVPNNDGALPLHLLCGSRPPVQTVKYLVSLFEGALALMTHSGDLPLMVACKTLACESVIQVLLTAYPDALIYMQEYYGSQASGGAP